MGSTTFVIPSVFTAIDKFSAPVKAMGNAVQGFVGRSERLLGRANTAFSKLISPLTHVNRLLMGMGVYVGLYTLIRVVKNAIQLIGDFEQAQLNISAVSHRSVSENKALSDQARKLAIDYGLAAKNVSSLQYELIKMGFAEKKGGMQNILDMTPAIVLGSKAMGAAEEQVAKVVGASMNLFKLPAGEVVDLFAKGLDISAMDFESFSHMIRTSQQAWALSGKKLPDLISHLGILSNSFVHAASAGTGLKNITIDNATAMKDMESQLLKIAKSNNPLVTGKKMYGRKAVLSAFPLAAAIEDGSLSRMLTKLNAEADGYAESLAKIKLAGLNAKWDLAVAAWQELILSIDDGQGPIAQSLKGLIDTARAALLIASGSDAAREALTKMDSKIVDTAHKWLFWAQVIKWSVIALFSMKVLLIAGQIAIAAYNVVMFAAMVATKAWAAGIWLVNAAMAANPIGLIVIAVAALVALLASAVMKFNEWGAAVLFLLGPLGFLPLVIMTIINHWDRMVKAFTNGGILEGLKAIGSMMLDVILYPLQQILEIIGKVTGFDWAANSAKGIEAFRMKLGGEEESKAPVQVINPKANDNEAYYPGNQNMKGRLDVHFNDPYGLFKSAESDSSFVVPSVSTTNTFGR